MIIRDTTGTTGIRETKYTRDIRDTKDSRHNKVFMNTDDIKNAKDI